MAETYLNMGYFIVITKSNAKAGEKINGKINILS
jgi:hypothetical protein